MSLGMENSETGDLEDFDKGSPYNNGYFYVISTTVARSMLSYGIPEDICMWLILLDFADYLEPTRHPNK